MFYRDERYDEIIISIPQSLCKIHTLTLADLEVYSYIHRYNIKNAGVFGIDDKLLFKQLDELNDAVVLKSLVNLQKLRLVVSKTIGKSAFYRSVESVKDNNLDENGDILKDTL